MMRPKSRAGPIGRKKKTCPLDWVKRTRENTWKRSKDGNRLLGSKSKRDFADTLKKGRAENKGKKPRGRGKKDSLVVGQPER